MRWRREWPWRDRRLTICFPAIPDKSMMRPAPPKALLFDCDGVLAESVDIKTEAFRELFHTHPAHIDQIIDYHRTNMGTSRFDKFDYIFDKILKHPLRRDERNRLGLRFANIVFRKVVSCPPVKGALPFLRKYFRKRPLFVLSATPQRELERILRRRGMAHYFKGIFGFPISKSEGIRIIKRLYGFRSQDLVFVGDSGADWKAARSERILFIGRRAPRNHSVFPKSIPQVKDLTQLEKRI